MSGQRVSPVLECDRRVAGERFLPREAAKETALRSSAVKGASPSRSHNPIPSPLEVP